jgi:hypothetical protein
LAKVGEIRDVDYNEHGNVFALRIIMIDIERGYKLNLDEPVSHIRLGKVIIPEFKRFENGKFVNVRPGDVLVLAKSNEVVVFITTKEAISDLKIADIIALTSNIDPDGSVWGFDTNCGKIDHLIAEARKILE